MVVSPMAQDVFSKMAEEPCLLKEDGYLNADTELKQIVYHPSLNVILICTGAGVVRVLDVNSGVVLQSTCLSENNQNLVRCRYIPTLDRVLFSNGLSLGVRSDYNGVLLLDTILQKTASSSRDDIKLELLLSEALILKQCFTNVKTTAVEHVLGELTARIQEAQKRSRKGIKAQKWNTVCLHLPLEVLRNATSNVITELLMKTQHSPEIGVVSAVQERVAELFGEVVHSSERRAMASEAKRRETFAQWPHMDYKWALPDQMAQAGFYHQPNSAGDDRAMCFTCTVCLVCWERTDEPWSEHERHSPTCPFVMGEYTQNVPLSVTYATNPAIDATYRGVEVETLGTSSVPNLLPTANREGLVSVFDVSGKVKQTHSFFVTQFDSHLLEKYTQDFGPPTTWSDTEESKNLTDKQITSVAIVGEKVNKNVKPSSIRPSVVCGLSIQTKESPEVMEIDDKVTSVQSPLPACTLNSSLYLVVYDFQYTKESDMEKDDKKIIIPIYKNEEINLLPTIKPFKDLDEFIITQDLYQNLIPGESDEIFIPPTPKNHSGPRVLNMDAQNTETDSAQATSLVFPPDYCMETTEKTISDHIADLQNSNSKKLNYSRAVQCVSIPEEYKNRSDLKVTEMLPTQDGYHLLVVLKSETKPSVYLVYGLDYGGKMVRVVEEPILIREVPVVERPQEISLISFFDKNPEAVKTSIEGSAITVCTDGAVRVMDLATLKTIAIAKLDSEKFVSAVYCNSLERLCASTEKGSLHFYTLNETDADSTEDHDDEDMLVIGGGEVWPQSVETEVPADCSRCFREPAEIIPLDELKRLKTLCEFEPFKGGYNPVVPPCWSEMQQAQRQRRHPQHLQKDKEQVTKTWRLQTDTTTWDEHCFEITLPTPVNIGHVDVNFALHTSNSIPKVELTLLRQITSSIGHRNVKFAVDETVSFDQLQNTKNPVISQEYLQSHNADILAGPVNISTGLDLTEQCGCVTLTSPKLFKSRNRNLLLHIKSVCSKDDVKSSTRIKRSITATNPEYMGCDCIHELSVTVFTSTHTEIPHERSLRCAMLESRVFVESLIRTAIARRNEDEQGAALDLLNWISCVRLARNRNGNGEVPGQQFEFLDCVEIYLPELLKECFLHVGRSIAHKTVKLITTCLDGATTICESNCNSFDTAMLNALLDMLDRISEIKSCGALHWLIVLMYKVSKHTELVKLWNAKCLKLLTEIAEQLNNRNNPYHLILRSRFGLYGTPLEPELFDIEPPSPLKSNSATVTYSSVVSGENVTQPADFHHNYACNRDQLDPKEVLLNLNETRAKMKNPTPLKTFRGLLETEPLHFTCVSASDGTRVERADANLSAAVPSTANTGAIFNGINGNPIFTSIPAPPQCTEHGGKDIEIYTDMPLLSQSTQEAMSNIGNSPIISNGRSLVDNVYQFLLDADNLKNEAYAKLFPCLIPDDEHVVLNATSAGSPPVQQLQQLHQQQAPSSESEHPPINQPSVATSTGTPQMPNKLPWQQLLVAPPQQVIVVERMHSGARRFVILDFGQPVLLTDLFLPTCVELLSLTVDIWLRGEDIDMQRLVLSSDISTRNLVLSDLQPPPLCRYLKITAVGRYGMSSTRCRIPVGYFYGHLVILPEEIPKEYAAYVAAPSTFELEKQLGVLSMLFEDVSCRYSLACSKLKNLLQPFLLSDASNTAHLNAYMDLSKDKNNCTTFDNLKIFNAYQEAITYQRQLNTVRNVMYRIESAILKIIPKFCTSIAEASSDKLRCISEVLLEILLIIDNIPKITVPICEKLFRGYCITQRSNVQFLAATVLDHSCRKKGFWGTFLADTLAKMFASNYTNNFPQDRVFILMAYLIKRCTERSVALDATLKVIVSTLQPLYTNPKTLLGVTIDLSLLGWLLLFLSLQLDLSKSSMQNSARWDWLTGEMAGKSADNVNSNYRRKLQKRFLQYKQQLDHFSHLNTKTVEPPQTISSASPAITLKLEEVLKGSEGIFSKIKCMNKKEFKISIYPGSSGSGTSSAAAASGSKQIGKRRREIVPETTAEKPTPIGEPQFVDPNHSLAVVKGLLSMLLAMDYSCSSDLFVLSCKIIARLVKLSNLNLDDYMNEESLMRFINLCIGSEIPFATHAVACLLQDVLDVGKIQPSENELPAASTSWTTEILKDVENLCDSFDMEDAMLTEPVPKQGKTTSSNNNHLPSVLESDDSEIEDFLDEILERGRTVLKKNPSVSKTGSAGGTGAQSGCSTAVDQRLDVTVEAQAEIALRKLQLYSAHALTQNVNSPPGIGETDCKVPKWPDELLIGEVSGARRRNGTVMLTSCFDALFKEFEIAPTLKMQQVLQIWLMLNSPVSEDKFNPSTMPFIPLSTEAINSLISTLVFAPDLSLRIWCTALQTLTLMCNVTQNSSSPEEELDMYRLFGKTSVIMNHKFFVQMLVKLLSGNGVQYCEKDYAGPALCKAMSDFLVRLQMRCDVTNPGSISGAKYKSYMLKLVYQLVQPNGPFAAKLGPLDAQCRLLSGLANLDFNGADLSMAMSILESAAVLIYGHVASAERVKCVNIGEKPNVAANAFNGIFATVLGGENNQDKVVSWEILLMHLLKVLANLSQTPLPHSNDHQDYNMELDQPVMSQTDESKVEQINLDAAAGSNPERPNVIIAPTVLPCLADTILRHHPSIIRLCRALARCKYTTICMIPYYHSAQSGFAELNEAWNVGDSLFNLLSSLAKKASNKLLVVEPLLLFLSQTPELSEPLLWFVIQILDGPDALRIFVENGGIQILCRSLVNSSTAANTISGVGNVSLVMQHFVGQTVKTDASALGVLSNTKKQQQASIESNLNLINFAPQGTIRCSTGSTAHTPEILIQGGQATHRRARAPQWSYHFYPEEAHADLTIQLPSAVLLREVHIQPHQGSLATCPSAVGLEISADGPSRLVPACPPLPTSGMSFIRLHLPVPEVVNCVQIRLYRPRDTSNIGLSQIRLLGTSAFGGGGQRQEVMRDLYEEESHCKYSLGWLRLLYHCCTLSSDADLSKRIVANAAEVEELLPTCCGLLLVPTHIPALYLGNLEKVLCDLSLFNRENGLRTIAMLLDSKPNVSVPSIFFDIGSGKLLMNSPGAQSACELLYRICRHQDENTHHRVSLILDWLKSITTRISDPSTISSCSPAYISIIASIIWDARRAVAMEANTSGSSTSVQVPIVNRLYYNLAPMVTIELFEGVYRFGKTMTHAALKYSVDSLLCSFCYVRTELFPLLLQKMGVLVPNQTTDRGASISDDRKDSEGMTDDGKRTFATSSEWYERLVMKDVTELYLSDEDLDSIALVSRSPSAIQQLLDSRLPKVLNGVILDYCLGRNARGPMCNAKKVTAILKFFADISEEKIMRDWLGSSDGSQFWLPLLQYLCQNVSKRSVSIPISLPSSSSAVSLNSEELTYLEEICVRFLSKCCLCHEKNQQLLATVLCDVISQQKSGISGFLRRLILQLLLENEKIPVSVKADETLYKNSTALHPYLPLHPAFKQTHDRALLYLGTNTTIQDILEQYVSFSTTLKNEQIISKKETSSKLDYLKTLVADSDLSVAAGVTAKDKRTKDAKNLKYYMNNPSGSSVATASCAVVTSKKKRPSIDIPKANDSVKARKVVTCTAMPNVVLPLKLTLSQVLQMIEECGVHTELPCLHLVISVEKGVEDETTKTRMNKMCKQRPLTNILQVFSSMGGLALLAQHLPTVYPETVRAPPTEKTVSDHFDDWIKVDGTDDIYEDLDEGLMTTSTPTKVSGTVGFQKNIPPHSLTAFGLFLRLPGYAEVLLRDMKPALCLLRLVLGVTDDGEGADIFQGAVADSLPTLPFEVLKKLYEATPLSTDDGLVLRRLSITTGVVHLVLACLGIFTHQTQSNQQKDAKNKDDKSQLYWAKGTGFGTGSTQQSWNVEQALLKQRSEEEHVTVLLSVLSSYINPAGDSTEELATSVLPPIFEDLLQNSALLPALSSYLRNDSVLDMARHIPLYRAALELLRAMAVSCQLVKLLVPQGNTTGSNGSSLSISSLLKNMKTCVDTYASKLRSAHAQTHKSAKKSNGKQGKTKYKLGELEELERDEGLAMLMPDIQLTATLVCDATDKFAGVETESSMEMHMDGAPPISQDELYLRTMKKLQFDTYEMIQELTEGGYKFVVSHHYEGNARSAGDSSHPARVKRLAQEAVTLATSLPLSYSSSVFVRCDADRLDIMKVLITGPADTPYANGCFEFDVYFPPDYPLAPMMINLETTGHHSVRFNPNLYNDGKVCLSVLNTWHGRPEEKWNAQTSSFLQVLVSIQSLILVPEPYFNEPGYERSRGTPSGTQSSKEYNANICQATVRWAMLEQLVNPCPCFKDVIHAHFYIKRQEIMEQCERWIRDLENDTIEKRTNRTSNKRNLYTSLDSFKKVYETFKVMLLKLKPPEGVEDDGLTNENETMEVVDGPPAEIDVDMEKMVNDMCE